MGVKITMKVKSVHTSVLHNFSIFWQTITQVGLLLLITKLVVIWVRLFTCTKFLKPWKKLSTLTTISQEEELNFVSFTYLFLSFIYLFITNFCGWDVNLNYSFISFTCLLPIFKSTAKLKNIFLDFFVYSSKRSWLSRGSTGMKNFSWRSSVT